MCSLSAPYFFLPSSYIIINNYHRKNLLLINYINRSLLAEARESSLLVTDRLERLPSPLIPLSTRSQPSTTPTPTTPRDFSASTLPSVRRDLPLPTSSRSSVITTPSSTPSSLPPPPQRLPLFSSWLLTLAAPSVSTSETTASTP